MAEQTFNQFFQGYWREPNKSRIPAESGVYCVYECTHVDEKNISIHKLIYIGESDDVNKRISNHEKKPDWQKHVGKGNELCYSFSEAVASNRVRVEATLINHHKPPVNVEYKDKFPFDKTTLTTEGSNYLLSKSFTVNRKD